MEEARKKIRDNISLYDGYDLRNIYSLLCHGTQKYSREYISESIRYIRNRIKYYIMFVEEYRLKLVIEFINDIYFDKPELLIVITNE